MLPPVGGLGLEQRWVLGAMDRSMAGIQGMQQCIEGRAHGAHVGCMATRDAGMDSFVIFSMPAGNAISSRTM